MRVLSFYTDGTPYEVLSIAQEMNIAEYNLNYTSIAVKDQGNWTANCAMKPRAILACLETQDDDIFYVDVDAVFVSDPREEFVTMQYADQQFLYPYWEKTDEVLSGSLYIENCPKSIAFIEYWISQQTPEEWDQVTLARCLDEWDKALVTGILPLEMCAIFDSMPEVTKPVIVHYQASRNLK